MSNSDRIKRVQAEVEDLLRSLTDEFIEEVASEDEAPESIVLGDWVLITHWIAPEGEYSHWYHELRSQGLSPHASLGLIHEILATR